MGVVKMSVFLQRPQNTIQLLSFFRKFRRTILDQIVIGRRVIDLYGQLEVLRGQLSGCRQHGIGGDIEL